MRARLKRVGAGRYAVIKPLGGRLPSRVFVAQELATSRLVVVKRFSVRDAGSWKEVELAEREAGILRSLDHELLPRYLDAFEERGGLYTVMTRMQGDSIESLRHRGESFGEQDVLELFRDATSVFAHLHQRSPPIVHRDLKPSNILRGEDGRFRFVDFGAATARRRYDGGSTVSGTFGYMAPEQFQGRASPASDLYSLAATALVMLTGEEPERLPHRGLAIDVEAAVGRAVSHELCRLLEEMLDPNPDSRRAVLRELAKKEQLGPPVTARLSKAVSAPGAISRFNLRKRAALLGPVLLIMYLSHAQGESQPNFLQFSLAWFIPSAAIVLALFWGTGAIEPAGQTKPKALPRAAKSQRLTEGQRSER